MACELNEKGEPICVEMCPIGMGRVSILTKHPNRFLAEGGAGGHSGAELKFAGYDLIIVEGKATGRSGC